MTRSRAHEILLQEALLGKRGYVCVSNVHTTMTGFFHREYRHVTNAAAFAVPDGVPLVWAMRSLGCPNQDRVRGPSLMRDLFDLGRAHQIRHYLYGGSPAALVSLRKNLEEQYPGALIVGAESPPFRPLESISEAEFAEVAERINASNPHFVWIGLGAPKQERWMYFQRNRVRGIMLGVGAAFDFHAGKVTQAPRWIQRSGFEWLFRLCAEPRRLWRRYARNNPLFLWRIAGQLTGWTRYPMDR